MQCHRNMDVDSDIDQKLLQMFSCLGTTDKDVLISEFQKLLGNQLNSAGCAFFLDMNNWNLQAAICSYYDFESPKDCLPAMAFVKDVTIGEGESVSPRTKFVKTWKVQYSGDEPWPPGCCLRFTCGSDLGCPRCITVDALKPQKMTDVSVKLESPHKPGIYQGQWRMCTPTGCYFGEIIWMIITVDESGLLGVTQQMFAFGGDLCSPPRETRNPFSSSGLTPYNNTPNRNCCSNHFSTSPDPSIQCIYKNEVHLTRENSTLISELYERREECSLQDEEML